MKLAAAPKGYDQSDQAQMRREILKADDLNIKANVAVEFVLMKKADGTVGKLTINASGTPVWSAL